MFPSNTKGFCLSQNTGKAKHKTKNVKQWSRNPSKIENLCFVWYREFFLFKNWREVFITMTKKDQEYAWKIFSLSHNQSQN